MGNVHMEATQINYREGDKKMSVAQAIKNAGNTGLAHTADIAPEFSTESAYSAGDFVYHNGSLYEFTANHAAGAWSTDDTRAATVGGKIASLESDVSNLNDIKANQITIAPAFSAEASYDPGDLVYYNGLSYRCVYAHEGEWDADDFAATTISNELSSLMSGLIGLFTMTNIQTTSLNVTVGANAYIPIALTDITGASALLAQGFIPLNAQIYSDSLGLFTTVQYFGDTWYVVCHNVTTGERTWNGVRVTFYKAIS